MPRAARIVFSSMPYHIISRGNNRERVFQQEEDFEKYLEICRRYKDQYEFRLYHWVLMNNHTHLLIETKENSSLSKIMQGINLLYCVKSPFTLIVIPGLTEPAPYSIRGNPVFPIWIPAFAGMTASELM